MSPSTPATPEPIAAVLWDMDGTLIDTEPEWMASEYALVEEFGGTWSHEDAMSLVGQALVASAKVLRERGGVALDDDELIARLMSRVLVAIKEDPQWRPGARELVAEVKAAGIPCALVTMSYSAMSDAVVAGFPEGTFDVVISGEMVENGKPHPEPYLRAAAELGVRIEDCVAIEDSLNGVASAQASGAKVLAVEHMVPVPADPGRSRVRTLTGIDVATLRRLVEGERIDMAGDTE